MEGRVPLARWIKLYTFYARMDLAWLLRDTKICLMAVCADFLSNIAAVTGIFLLAWRFDGVGGMNRFEVLFMLGYVTLATGMFQTFFSNCNTGHISRRIGRGQMEHMFIQPLPLWVQLMTEGFIPVTGSSNLLSGSFIVAVALHYLALDIAWWWLGLLLVHQLITLGMLLALTYLFSTAAFYAPVQAEEIATYVTDSTGNLSIYPLSGMALALQLPLISVFPAGLMGWFPTLALLGEPPLGLPSVYPLVVFLLLFSVAFILFRKGLSYYVTTGSNRYSPAGHRR